VKQVLLATPTGKYTRCCPRTICPEYIFDLGRTSLGMKPAKLSEILVDCSGLQRVGWDDDPGHPRQEGHPKSETLSQTHGAYHEHKNIKSLRITVSASQPFLIRTFLPLLILELFIPPVLHNSAGWLKVLKHNFCDDSDRTLWVEP